MHRPIPVGHHNAEQMAQLLGFKSKKAFYKKMRELGWLHVDTNGVKFGRHNQPKKEIVELGYAYSMACSYGTGSNKEIDREYYVPIFTQAGLDALKQILKDGKPMESVVPPKPIRQAHCSPEEAAANTPSDRAAIMREREEALKSLREMGILQ